MAACRPPHHSYSSESLRIEILAQQKVATLVGTRNGGGGEIRPSQNPVRSCSRFVSPGVRVWCMPERVYKLYSRMCPRASCYLFPRGSVSSFLFLFFFKLTHPLFSFPSHPRFTPPSFAPVFTSRLAPHSPFSRFSLHLFAPSLSAPSSLLWSDHKANPYQMELDNAPQNFSQELFFPPCACVHAWTRHICL